MEVVSLPMRSALLLPPLAWQALLANFFETDFSFLPSLCRSWSPVLSPPHLSLPGAPLGSLAFLPCLGWSFLFALVLSPCCCLPLCVFVVACYFVFPRHVCCVLLTFPSAWPSSISPNTPLPLSSPSSCSCRPSPVP